MPDRGLPAPPIGDEPVQEIGWLDWHVATALTDLQRGSVATARDRLERLVIGDEPNCYAASALRAGPLRPTATRTALERSR